LQAEVTFLTRRGAAVMRRSHTATGQSIRLGRATGNEVQLPDIRVQLEAAALSQRADGLLVERLGDLPLRVNGVTINAAPVRPGDEILIGPYKLILSEPPAGFDAAFSIELVDPPGDALLRLTAGSRVRLDQTGVSKRRASWIAFLVLLIVCLAVPVGIYLHSSPTKNGALGPGAGGSGFLAVAWSPGETSIAHRYFENQCVACHQSPFAAVQDSACLTCHSGIGGHIPASSEIAGPARSTLERMRCADCHQEHRGARGLVIQAGALCQSCHRSLAETAPDLGLRDVHDFSIGGHPQFRVTLVDAGPQPKLVRVDLGAQPKPTDHPGLVFSHAAHLVKAGFPKLGIKPMMCSDCHIAEPSGQGFLPITFEGQCRRCHALKFDAGQAQNSLYLRQNPEVPHGDAGRVRAFVEGFFSSLALRGGVEEPQAPEIVRRVPGTPFAPTEAQRREAEDWVAQKAKETLAIVYFEPKRGCAFCHRVERHDDSLSIAPVKLLTRFLSPARFDHARHQPVACLDCHAAARSEASSDVLIPGIATCVRCHGTETARFATPSTCISCHVFHRHELGPMRPSIAMDNR
jgi:predicted CXXCH cytochrome family protein